MHDPKDARIANDMAARASLLADDIPKDSTLTPRASDRVRQKMGNSAAFSREIIFHQTFFGFLLLFDRHWFNLISDDCYIFAH